MTMAVRYLGEQGGAQYASASEGRDNYVVTIRPETWFSQDYNKAVTVSG